MKQKYIEKNFRAESLQLIAYCDKVLRGYISRGFVITVRTLYYQLVSQNIIRNKEEEYKRLTGLINDARMAGLIDWDVIEDRGRRPLVRGRWGSGKEFLESCAPGYHTDHWEGQDERVFVVVEKDALAGVLERKCREYDVPLLAAKGYPSVSSIRDLVHDQIMPYIFDGWSSRANPGKLPPGDKRQRIVFLHMGDHDPSGLDMSRDLEERLRIFGERAYHLEFKRIALNMDQIEEQQPPPNPAKSTDSRFKGYQDEHGDESWELDALQPDFLNELLETNIKEHIDQDKWDERAQEIEDTIKRLEDNAEDFAG